MPRVNPELVSSALAHWRTFLLPILSPPGAPSTFGKCNARLRLAGRNEENPEFKALARAYADRLSRLIREPRPRAAYPEPDTLWEMGKTFRFGGLHWVWAPVLYYASGHLRSLVETIATVDSVRLTPASLLGLLHALPRAVQGDVRARSQWTLQYGAREAFLGPDEAAGRMRFPLPDDLFLAYVLADRFELPYELRRNTVLQYMVRWVESLPQSKQSRNQQ